jgi:hypothetical protein
MAKTKNPAAVALGRLGGLAGKGKPAPKRGLSSMSPERRSEIAKMGAAKRWPKKVAAKKKAKKGAK